MIVEGQTEGYAVCETRSGIATHARQLGAAAPAQFGGHGRKDATTFCGLPVARDMQLSLGAVRCQACRDAIWHLELVS